MLLSNQGYVITVFLLISNLRRIKHYFCNNFFLNTLQQNVEMTFDQAEPYSHQTTQIRIHLTEYVGGICNRHFRSSLLS